MLQNLICPYNTIWFRVLVLYVVLQVLRALVVQTPGVLEHTVGVCTYNWI